VRCFQALGCALRDGMRSGASHGRARAWTRARDERAAPRQVHAAIEEKLIECIKSGKANGAASASPRCSAALGAGRGARALADCACPAGYPPAHGTVDARRAIAETHSTARHPVTENDVVIASGASGALDITLQALLNPGDNVLLPVPGFSLYPTLCAAYGFEARNYHLLVRLCALPRPPAARLELG
jgi:aspartate/methionine/tyrosine aminotransferase